jgi:hypothetical protein
MAFRGGAKRGIGLHRVDHLAILVQIHKIEWEENSRFGDSAERRQPKTLTGLELELFDPVSEFVERQIGSSHFQAEEALASLVVCAIIPRFH